MNVFKKLFSKTKTYKILSWIHGRYMEDQYMENNPERFRKYGEGVHIDRNVSINMPERVILNDHVVIHKGTVINSMGGLYIGRYTGIGYNCAIFTVQHRYRNSDTIPFDRVADLKPVIIRDFVWFGFGVMVMPGVEIGEGAILGMGSVITKKVPPLAIVTGNPAEIIGYRSKEHFNKCKEEEQFQSGIVGDYEENLIRMYKIRYEKELKELGML